MILVILGPALLLAVTIARAELAPEEALLVHYKPESAAISITASFVPLRSVLDEITQKTGVVFQIPRNMNPIVSLSVQDLSLERAIKQLFGASTNAAMIYVEQTEPPAPNRFLLAEVRVLDGGAAPVSTARSAAAAVPAVPAAPPVPQLSPEELAARRAEKEAKRTEKEKAKADRQQSRRGGRGSAGSSQTEPSQEVKSDPSNPQPSVPAASSGSQGRNRKGR